MTAVDRADEIVEALRARGVRATVDPQAASPPCVLVPPPGRTFDLSCGYTARWELAALAPAAGGANRQSWAQLDELATAVADVFPLETANLVNLNLSGTEYPAYLLAWTESI